MKNVFSILRRSKIHQIGPILGQLFITTSIVKGQDSITAIIKQVEQAVVTIITYDLNGDSLKLGSGFFISHNHVISNRHVLEEAHHGEIKTAAGKVYPIEGVVGEDDADLIQFQVNIPASEVKPLKVSKTSLQKGEKIVVVGSPVVLEHSISNGIVSFVQEVSGFGHLIQITAPVFHGHSGSPVVNLKGEVIGVATRQMVPEQNLNFALPGERVTALKVGKLQTLSVWAFESSATDWLPEADSLYWRGLAFLWVEDYGKALPNFEKAAKKNPRYAQAYFQIGYCNSKLGRFQEAVKAYEEATRVKPDYVEAHHKLGTAYSRLGLYEKELQAYKQAILIQPNNAEVHRDLGAAYASLGRYQEAVKTYKQATQLNPDFVDAYCNLGATYGFLNQYQEAVDAFKQAIRLKPKHSKAHYGLGLTYLMFGKKQSALEEYKILQTLDKELANKLHKMIYK